jgi:iron complex transport system substrate-binding protein
MRARIRFAALLALTLLLAAAVGAFAAPVAPKGTVAKPAKAATLSAKRIVSVSAPVTEVLFALGAGNRVVGIDLLTQHPAETSKLPRVGYERTLSAEGILATKPDLVLAGPDAGPPATMDQLRSAGVRVVTIESGHDLTGALSRIRGVANAIGMPKEGEALARKTEQGVRGAEKAAAALPPGPKVMFVHARGAANLFVAGQATAGDELIRLAGASNAFVGFEGYRPVSSEAVVAASPEVILIPTGMLERMGGIDGLLAQPGFALTPAAKTRRVVELDSPLLMAIGPATPGAVSDLAAKLRGTTAAPVGAR